MTTDPAPIIPDYSGPNVRGIMPALLGPHGWASGVPPWMPDVITEAEQVVVLVLDGLGWDQLNAHRAHLSTIAAMTGQKITTVAPTTTATALSSIVTGLTPAEHGLIGYRMMLGRDVLNVLRWSVDGEPQYRQFPPSDIQRYPGFLGHRVPVVCPIELAKTPFSAAHQDGAMHIGWRAPSSMALDIVGQLHAGESFVYAYYGTIDKIAHERGFGPYYEAELRAADRLVADLLTEMPANAVLIVTSDHGQVQVGPHVIHPSNDLLTHVAAQSGEGRFRWFHAHPGAGDDLFSAVVDELGSTGWVMTRDEIVERKVLGHTVSRPIMNRLGDVAVLARDDVAYHDPDDSGPFELQTRHGSLTSAEVYVPLLAAFGSGAIL